MTTKLSFKEYLESKELLRSAVDNTPQRIAEYNVRKYCKLTVGEDKENKQHVSLKPNNKIFVEWLYEDVDNPTPVTLRFEGSKDVDPEENLSSLWTGERLIKWLLKNTREIS